jgi:uncharacterized membrane protein
MASLALAALYWVLLHFIVAGPARPTFAALLGERGFQGMFALLSAAGLGWLIVAYVHAPEQLLWICPPGGRVAALVIVFIAFILFAYGAIPSATSPAVAALPQDHLPVVGITRITRDPMLWSFALWAAAHLLANGDVASALLFGAILVTALNGMVSIDRKRRRALGAVWDEFTAHTSIIPFAAIVAGRNELRLEELPLWRAVLGLALFLAALLAHPYVIGVSPLPG